MHCSFSRSFTFFGGGGGGDYSAISKQLFSADVALSHFWGNSQLTETISQNSK